MHLDYNLEMLMRSQMDMRKEELMDSTMKGIPREMHLVYHLEMMMRSQMDLRKEKLFGLTMV
jgi:hypothetical protein